MADFTRPRDDLGFMRRRVSPATATAAAPPTTPAATSSLNLSVPATSPTSLTLAPAKPAERSAPAPAPERARVLSVATVAGKLTLTDAAPLARLSRRSSAIGSLVITGADTVAWEAASGESGVIGSQPLPPARGNRALVERLDANVFVSLHHIRELRRIILNGDDVTLTTFAGHAVINPGAADTYLSVIDGVIEVRREPRSADIPATYSIGAQTPT